MHFFPKKKVLNQIIDCKLAFKYGSILGLNGFSLSIQFLNDIIHNEVPPYTLCNVVYAVSLYIVMEVKWIENALSF